MRGNKENMIHKTTPYISVSMRESWWVFPFCFHSGGAVFVANAAFKCTDGRFAFWIWWIWWILTRTWMRASAWIKKILAIISGLNLPSKDRARCHLCAKHISLLNKYIAVAIYGNSYCKCACGKKIKIKISSCSAIRIIVTPKWFTEFAFRLVSYQPCH